MNRKFLVLIALTLGVGAFYFLRTPPSSERSDVVIVHEKPAPSRAEVSSTTQETKISNEGHESLKVNDSDSEKRKESLKQELKDVLTKLPTLENLQDLSDEDVHATPVVVKDGGVLVGQMLEAAIQNPERREETLHFFLECAESPTLVPAIRAVCWNKLLTQIAEWKIFVPIADAKVPNDIKSLAMKLR